ncbi:MAG TPA: DNA primase [Streptosporangiaceae bacterium]
MAGRIRDEDIALVRERAAIDEVVGEYLQLRNAGGGSLKGLCPFHDEKTPSFNVTPARGLWYCFSCAEGGDVIKFVQKIDNLSFVEAVERLADRAGLELRYEQGGQVPGREHSQRRRLIEAHKAAADFFAERLLGAGAAAAHAFLAERGFEQADAERFGVGYAPAEWEALTRHLRGRGFTEQELLVGGLATQGRRGAMDRFRGRLIWPIRDLTGDVIAFGARKLNPDEDGPKYLNTPETPLFKKSSVLYGADLAKRDIAQRRQAVIVEGYTDVMACHLAGVTTAVATSGTSFGEDHVKILRRLLMDADWQVAEVIFTFDGDAAGQKAALRAFHLEERFATQTFVAVQPDGLDPCDLRLKQGDAAVRDLIARRQPVYEFAVRSELARHNLDTNEGRLAALDAAAPIIARIKDRGLRDRYAVSLDRWLGLLNEEFVLARIRGVSPGGRPPGPPDRRSAPGGGAAAAASTAQARAEAAPYNASDPVVNLERQVLKLAVQRPALCGPAFDTLDQGDFSVPVHGAVRELIAGCGGVAAAGPSREWASQLIGAAPNDRAREFVTRLAVEAIEAPRSDGEPDARYAEAVLARVEELAVSRRITELKSRLQRLNPADSQYNRAFGDLVALEQRRKALLDQAGGAL